MTIVDVIAIISQNMNKVIKSPDSTTDIDEPTYTNADDISDLLSWFMLNIAVANNISRNIYENSRLNLSILNNINS